jgi:hypothetical protein
MGQTDHFIRPIERDPTFFSKAGIQKEGTQGAEPLKESIEISQEFVKRCLHISPLFLGGDAPGMGSCVL